MKRVGHATKNGFTIIEVTLYLALTALIFVGIIASTRGSFARQRYVSSVNSVVSHLRSIYDELEHPSLDLAHAKCYGTFAYDVSGGLPSLLTGSGGLTQKIPSVVRGLRSNIARINEENGLESGGTSRSGCAIYGEMINFINDGGSAADGANRIQHIPIVGFDIDNLSNVGNDAVIRSLLTGDTYNILYWLGADNIVVTSKDSFIDIGNKELQLKDNAKIELSSAVQEYTLENGASVKMKFAIDGAVNTNTLRRDFSMVILKNPFTGEITTDIIYKGNNNGAYDDYDAFNASAGIADSTNQRLSFYYYLFSKTISGMFSDASRRTYYLCINPGSGSDTSAKRAIYIDRGIQSSSAINLLDIDESKALGVCN